jgi:GNAT superfamily N-acetyltransferase
MLTIKVLDLLNLKGKEKTAYKQLLPEKYRGYISGQDPQQLAGSQLIGIGACVDDIPVGLIAGAYRPVPVPSELYVFAVSDIYQGQDVEKRLFGQFEDWLRAKNVQNLMTVYQTGQNETSTFENLLWRNGWKQGNQVKIRCHFNAITFSPAWLHQDYPLPAGCEQFFWRNISSEDKEKLEKLIEQGAIPSRISPFVKDGWIDKNSSIGLRCDGEIIGWMINHRIKPDTVEFRSFFIFREYYSLGHAMRLLTQSIHLVQQSPPRHAIVNIYTNQADNRWIQFARKRLLPYAESVDRWVDAWKHL